MVPRQRELERLKTRVVALNKPGGAISALKSDYGKKTLNACLQGAPLFLLTTHALTS